MAEDSPDFPDLPSLPRRKSVKKPEKTKAKSKPASPPANLNLWLSIGGGGVIVVAIVIALVAWSGRGGTSRIAANDPDLGRQSAPVAAGQPPAAAAALQAPQPTLVAKILNVGTKDRIVIATGVSKLPDNPRFFGGTGQLELHRDSDDGKSTLIEVELTRSDNTAPWPKLNDGAIRIRTESGEFPCLLLRDSLTREIAISNLWLPYLQGVIPNVVALKKLVRHVVTPYSIVLSTSKPNTPKPSVAQTRGVRTVTISEYRETMNGPFGKELFVADEYGIAVCIRESPFGQMRFSGTTRGTGELALLDGTLDFTGERKLEDAGGPTLEGQVRFDAQQFINPQIPIGPGPQSDQQDRGSPLEKTKYKRGAKYRAVVGELTVKYPTDILIRFNFPEVSGVENPDDFNSHPNATIQWDADGATAWYVSSDLPPEALPKGNKLNLSLVVLRPPVPGKGVLHIGDAVTAPLDLP